MYWLLSFFGQVRLPDMPHSDGLTDLLAVVIVTLIAVKFLA
jgi:hypothetical protein